MKVLVVGAGAREHALVWKLSQSPEVERLFCLPGNAGTRLLAHNVLGAAEDLDCVVAAAREHAVDLVVVGPEGPLCAGLTDRLADAGVLAFGPSREAARLEASKAYSKEFMARHGIATAGFRVFDEPTAAEDYIRAADRPLVIKADGLAAGKGVVVAPDRERALCAVRKIMREGSFGSAGDRLVVEECLVGQEVSFHAICDGTSFVALAPAQDHKRVGDGDVGPNTGGMGAYSPPPVVTAELERKIVDRVIEPTLRGMADEGHPFRGVLFVGLMIVEGEPLVLEYNVRFGDPETQVLMARLGGDLLPLLLGAARGDLAGATADWSAPAALCVVLASGGYPGSYAKGCVISGLDAVGGEALVFHAGTAQHGEQVVTSGGRVVSVTAAGSDVDQAAASAYAAAERVQFEGVHYRRDIGHYARAPVEHALSKYVEALRRGFVVACPTETLHGLLADARNPGAVAEVARLKGRAGEPIALLVPDAHWLEELASEVTESARSLMQAHWPGALTLVVRARPGLPAELTSQGTVGVRVPAASPALDLVRAFGAPLTATSANLAGQPAARSEAEVRAYFGEALQHVVPGDAPGGAPSTVVDVTGPEPRILRAGAVRVDGA